MLSINDFLKTEELVPTIISLYCKKINKTIVARLVVNTIDYKNTGQKLPKRMLTGLKYQGTVVLSEEEIEELKNPLVLCEEGFLGEGVVIFDVSMLENKELICSFTIGKTEYKNCRVKEAMTMGEIKKRHLEPFPIYL